MSAAVAPVVPEYFPAAHSVHAEADAAAKVPREHFVHSKLPSILLNVPAAQAMQVEVILS